MNWFDAVIIVILIYSTFRGYSSGMILSLTGLFGFLLGLFVALKNYKALADFLIVGWQMDEKLAPLFKPLLNMSTPTNSHHTMTTTLDQTQQSVETMSPLMTKIIDSLNLGLDKTIGDALVLALAQGLLSIICFIILLIATDLIIKIIGRLINGLIDWSILAPFNRLGGAVFGVARGILIIMIIIAVLMPLQVPALLLGGETFIAQGIKDSQLSQVFLNILSNTDWSPAGILEIPNDYQQFLDII